MLVRWLIAVAIFGIYSVSAQARDVSISLDGTQMSIVLTNPSTVPVNYNIVCHKADASGTVLNLTNQTLAPNAQVKHNAGVADSGLCNGGAAPNNQGTDIHGKPYYFCDGSNNYSNANNACGAGNTFCFPDISSPATPIGCSAFNYWLKNDGAVQYQVGCSAYGALTGSNQAMIGTSGSGFSGNVKKSASAGGCSYFWWANQTADTATAGAVCCSSPSSGSLCKVTINTTATGAYLSSPSFMGGAAF